MIVYISEENCGNLNLFYWKEVRRFSPRSALLILSFHLANKLANKLIIIIFYRKINRSRINQKLLSCHKDQNCSQHPSGKMDQFNLKRMAYKSEIGCC